MIQAVLFDLDGTLLDRDTSLSRFVHDQFEEVAKAHAVIDDLAEISERVLPSFQAR